jgi:DnaJ-class molecular chaperone
MLIIQKNGIKNSIFREKKTSSFFETYFHSGFGSEGGLGGRYTTRSSRARVGQDVELEVEVTLAEAYRGAARTFEVADGSTRRLEVKIPATKGRVYEIIRESKHSCV